MFVILNKKKLNYYRGKVRVGQKYWIKNAQRGYFCKKR
jgi:hypothetical protein